MIIHINPIHTGLQTPKCTLKTNSIFTCNRVSRRPRTCWIRVVNVPGVSTCACATCRNWHGSRHSHAHHGTVRGRCAVGRPRSTYTRSSIGLGRRASSARCTVGIDSRELCIHSQASKRYHNVLKRLIHWTYIRSWNSGESYLNYNIVCMLTHKHTWLTRMRRPHRGWPQLQTRLRSSRPREGIHQRLQQSQRDIRIRSSGRTRRVPP